MPEKRKPDSVFSFLLSFFSGILLSLPFLNGNLWLISWFGFVPLFIAWEGRNKREVFLISLLAGLVFFSATIYWLIHVTLIGQIVLIIYLSFYFPAFGFLIYLKRQSSALFTLFFIPSVWVLLEFLRSNLFTGFGWALLGYSQYKNLPIIQIADITGAYGVSFLIMMANVAIWLLISKIRSKSPEARSVLLSILISVFCILFTIVYGFLKLHSSSYDDKKLKVSIIQGNIPQELKWQGELSEDILLKHLQLTRAAALDKPSVIIWPESSLPRVLREGDLYFSRISALAEELKIPVLIGAVTSDDVNYYNSAILVSPHGQVKERYDKLHLVPFGEYLPLKKIFAFANNLTAIPIGDFTPGKEYTLFFLDDKIKCSVFICFEDAFPQLSREFTKRGAEFLIDITNDAWFKQTQAPYQHLQASVFRAVENHRSLVRAANTGVSCFIDPCGRIIDRISDKTGRDIFISGYKTHDIAMCNAKTLYTGLGDIFAWVCVMFAACGLIIKKASPKSKN